jgi:hypothetical protein
MATLNIETKLEALRIELASVEIRIKDRTVKRAELREKLDADNKRKYDIGILITELSN